MKYLFSGLFFFFVSFSSQAGIDVLKYHLKLDLYSCYYSPFPYAFSGSVEIKFRVETPLNTIHLNASNTSLIITSVGGAGKDFVHASDTLTIRLKRAYKPGEQATVVILYRHAEVMDQAVFCGNGWFFTDSPPEGARKWFPCQDLPSDKALWELEAKVPPAVRLGSNGSLADSVMVADTLVYRWVSKDPLATYLMSISSRVNWRMYHGSLSHKGNPVEKIPLLLFYKPGESLGKAVEALESITAFYEERFGRYPFEKIGFATLNNLFQWGGMENQTMINLQPGGYEDPNLLAHEHAHHWFGDLITCATWADVWLNESFATYCQNLWVEKTRGDSVYREGMRTIAGYYLSDNPGWALYQPVWMDEVPPGNVLYSLPVVYYKGACVLHQLRYVLGDSVFFTTLKSYATDPELMFKNVSTRTAVAKFERYSGTKLEWFFDEWVYHPDHPIYENHVTLSNELKGGYRMGIRIDQQQKGTCFFTMPLEFNVIFSDGSDTLLRVMNSVNHQQFDWIFVHRPKKVTFDPYDKILLKKQTTFFLEEPTVPLLPSSDN